MICEAVKPSTEMSLSAMVAEYNALAAPLGKTPVKRFSDKESAQRRLNALRSEVATASVEVVEPAVEAVIAEQVIELEVADAAEQVELVELTAKYNRLANVIGEPGVEGFVSVAGARDRLAAIEVRVQEHYASLQPSTRRQKCFNYPPMGELKKLKPGTLRAEARDLLAGGATVAEVESLVAAWDRKNGDEPYRLEPRAYGLIRLLNNYVGYALREEGTGANKRIYLMTEEEWNAWRASKKSTA